MNSFRIQNSMRSVQHQPSPAMPSAAWPGSSAHAAPRTSRLGFRGFTLTELMVAIAITALLILAINQVFSTVSKAVRTGLGASEIIQNSRIIGQQIENDFDDAKLYGPGSSGVLVIVNHKITNSNKGVHILRTDDLDEDGTVDTSDPDENRTAVRDDQLMFIRAGDDINPISPNTTTDYSADTSNAEVKIWYGHALISKPNGEVPSNQLGEDYSPSDADAIPANHFAGEWVLARQALFLDENRTTNIRATNGAIATASVPGSGAPVSTLRGGISDIAQFGFDVEEATNGCMVGDDADVTPTPVNSSVRLWKTSAGNSAGSNEYATRAYAYLYLPPNRLLVNPKPAAASDYPSWQLAQMTPYLCGHVSDFVVEFAGDYATNNNPDPGDEPSGAPDGKLDRYSDGSIVWYGLTTVPPTGAVGTNDVFVNVSNSTPCQNPIFDNTRSSDDDIRYVFRHDVGATAGAGTNWPYLIRIRYRLVDSKGQIAGADGLPGRWFEQIVKVNR